MFEEVIYDDTRMRKIDIEPGYACVIVSDQVIEELIIEKGGYYE